jgi:signal peptidase II
MSGNHAMRKYYFLIAVIVVLLDRATKWWIAHTLAIGNTVPVIPGFFRLTHVQNRGAAFGLFDDSPTQLKIGILILFSVVALVVVMTLLWKNSHTLTATGVGLSLVMGGAVGNLWDRLFTHHVVDFLDFYIRSYHWPAFNVADTAIVSGAILLVSEIAFAKNPRREANTVESN